MKKLSETYKELGIAFEFPIEIKDADGNVTYYEGSDGRWWKREYDAKGRANYAENSDGYWCKSEYDDNGYETYYENSDDYWCKRKYDAKGNRTYYETSVYREKREYDADGNETYCENSNGEKRGTPKSAKTCEGKVVEVDGIKYKLTAL